MRVYCPANALSRMSVPHMRGNIPHVLATLSGVPAAGKTNVSFRQSVAPNSRALRMNPLLRWTSH